MFGLSLIDILVIAVYFGGMIAIGVWCSRRIKNQEDYFLAGRGFGKLIQTFAAFGQGTSADNAVGVTTTTFVNGASGIWSSLLYLFGTPVYWLVCPWLRRLRVLTLGDFFRERYGSTAMAAVYAVIGSIGMMSFIALGFSAMTKTILAITPKTASQFTAADIASYQAAVWASRPVSAGEVEHLAVASYQELLEREQLQARSNSLTSQQRQRLALLEAKAPARLVSHLQEHVLIWIVCFIVLIYAVAGGLEAAFITDLIQGVFIILLSVILIPFAWGKINALYGGHGMIDALRTVHRRLPEAMFDIFGSPHSIDFTWYYIVVLSVMACLTVFIQPNMLVANGSARNEYAARYGFTVGSFLKRFCTLFWGVFGLASIVIYASRVPNSDLVWGYATRDLLGPLGLGLVGLMIAALMAALMSTADCLMLTCSSLLTHNLYAAILPGRSDRHYVWAGRVFGALVLVGSVLIATQFDRILYLLKFIWSFNVMIAPAFWLGMKWRRANCPAAWTTIVGAGLLFLVLPVVLPWLAPWLRTEPYLLTTTNPAPLVRTYMAGEGDMRRRGHQIRQWEQARAAGKAQGARPKPLALGEEFTEIYRLPRKSIFWAQGIHRNDGGTRAGRGSLSLELAALHALGIPLSAYPYALNETISITIRTVLPFLIMVAVALLTRSDNSAMLDRFYAKMRTQVEDDPQTDAQELAQSLEDVHRHQHRLLWPRSQWEFYRWDREDWYGFLLAIVGVVAVLALMTVLVRLGS